MNGYTITYEPQTVAGERGWWCRIYRAGKQIAEIWSRGSKAGAEAGARAFLAQRGAA